MRRLIFCGGVALAALTTACSADETGQIVLAVQSDLSLPKDIDAIRIEVTADGVPKFKNDYQRLGSPDGEIHLPGTLGLVAADNADTAVDVIVSARSGGQDGELRIVREVVTTVPTGRVAGLQLPLQFLCDGSGKIVGGNVTSDCDKGKTCIAGTCSDEAVDASTLPDYSDDGVFGDGSCFDVAACFASAVIVDVDLATCSVPATNGVNFALETQGAGICGTDGCFAALDAESDTGWKTASGAIKFPPAVCTQLGTGQVAHVVQASISASCPQKVVNLPTCGSWSTSTQTPQAVGAIALASGQAHPASLVLKDDGALAWTNGGTSGKSDGSVKTVDNGGGTPEAVKASVAARDVATDGSDLFYTTAVVGTTAKGGVWNGGVQLLQGLDQPEGVTVVNDVVFFAEFTKGEIWRADAKTPEMAKSRISSAGTYPYRLATDGVHVYWTNEGTKGADPPDGSIARVPFGGGTTETLVSGLDTPRAIAIDRDAGGSAKAIYYATFAAKGQLARIDISGSGGPVVIADNLAYPNGIAIDATHVYWTNRDAGTVQRIKKGATSGAETIAEGRSSPGAITVDDSSVYWIDAGPSDIVQGTVVRLAK